MKELRNVLLEKWLSVGTDRYGEARTASGWFENSKGEGGARRRCGNSDQLSGA